jgi:hypothetical protein
MMTPAPETPMPVLMPRATRAFMSRRIDSATSRVVVRLRCTLNAMHH